VLHLLYARFWHKVLYDIGVVSTPEPFMRLVHQGMILGEDGQKMSKSVGNVVNPDDLIDRFGADALRIYEMFMGPLESVKPWQMSGIQGARRFLDRLHAIATRPLSDAPADEATERLVHRTVKDVTERIETLRFNTAISLMMTLANHLNSFDQPQRNCVEKLVLLASPFAPHLAEELWEQLGHPPSIADVEWPTFDEKLTIDDTLELPVQVNGKIRGRVVIARDADESTARAAALADENVQKHLEGRPIRKLVYVPGRILNLIV
jgi:leucyl-tRNA synthetase